MILRVLVAVGIASVVVRSIVGGWDWLYEWMTDWWAWAVAAVVFVGLEVTKRALSRRRARRS